MCVVSRQNLVGFVPCKFVGTSIVQDSAAWPATGSMSGFDVQLAAPAHVKHVLRGW